MDDQSETAVVTVVLPDSAFDTTVEGEAVDTEADTIHCDNSGCR